jgi:hypothetical protein
MADLSNYQYIFYLKKLYHVKVTQDYVSHIGFSHVSHIGFSHVSHIGFSHVATIILTHVILHRNHKKA